VHADVVAELLDHAVDADIDQPELASSDGDGGAPLCPEGNGLTEEEGRMGPGRGVVRLELGVRPSRGDAYARDADRVAATRREKTEVRAERDGERVGQGERLLGRNRPWGGREEWTGQAYDEKKSSSRQVRALDFTPGRPSRSGVHGAEHGA